MKRTEAHARRLELGVDPVVRLVLVAVPCVSALHVKVLRVGLVADHVTARLVD